MKILITDGASVCYVQSQLRYSHRWKHCFTVLELQFTIINTRVMANEVLTKRGNEKFVHNGYLYVFDKISKANNELKFWRCERKNRCKARLHTIAGEVVEEMHSHTHEPSAAQIEAATVKTKLRTRAKDTLESPSTVINECLTNVSQASLAVLPDVPAMRKIISRQRNCVTQAPSNPTDLRQLSLPDCYKIYVPQPGVEENFLLCDSGPGPDRILIFGRQSWLQHLAASDIWFVDGTFSIAPNLFSQIYVISAKKHGGVHPVVYALLPNKQRTTYIRMFELLKESEPDLKPTSIVCDFEQAAHSAMRDSFPGIQIQGCFFHLSQNMHKHLDRLGFTSLYNADPDFALKAKMIFALAFVPLDKIDEYLDALSTELPEELQDLLNWFEDNYVGRQNRRGNGRRAPLFHPEIWNLHQRTLNGEDRTNNHAEAAHRRLQYELGMQHPTIWKLIDGLRKVQKGRDRYYESLLAGHEPPQKLKKYRNADRRILETVHKFENMAIIEYLRSIAHNYQMQ